MRPVIRNPVKHQILAGKSLTVIYSKNEQRKNKEKTGSLNPGGSAEGSWDASKIQMVTAEKHNHRPEGTTDGSVHAQEEK